VHGDARGTGDGNGAAQQSVHAARRLTQAYIEHRAGRRLKALDLLEQLPSR
jgi:hypothetical protein